MKPTVVDDDFEEAEEENKVINEEYKIWKKNAPYLYDLLITHALDWPSLTCQWFPDKEDHPNKPYTTHRLLLGTHTSQQAPDYLQIATVQIPKREGPGSDTIDRSNYDDERGELGGHTIAPTPRIEVIQRINHQGEVNRARYMPQKPDLIATKAVSGEVLVFDRTRHPSDPERNGVCKPDIRLLGQTKEGFGLAWSPMKEGHILGASEDKTVCYWDVNAYTKAKSSIEPLTIFNDHSAVVGDVDWHPSDGNVFASVSDDKTLKIWDTRQKGAVKSHKAHDQEVMAVAFCPANGNLIITGSADKTIALFDIRKLDKKHTFEWHTSEVLQLTWSPHNPTVFASASSDRRINVWDLNKIGEEQTPDDQEDGPPELIFVHGGHTSRPTDLCWAPGTGENWTMTTTSEDNIVMVWQPTMRIWAGEDVVIDEKELEDVAMEGVESTSATKANPARARSSGTQSMSMSTSVSVAGGDMEES